MSRIFIVLYFLQEIIYLELLLTWIELSWEAPVISRESVSEGSEPTIERLKTFILGNF